MRNWEISIDIFAWIFIQYKHVSKISSQKMRLNYFLFLKKAAISLPINKMKN